jgi:hypothetical protein
MSPILATFDVTPGLEITQVRPMTQEDKDEIGWVTDDKIAEMTIAYHKAKKELN